MKLKTTLFLPLICFVFILSSCESDAERKERLTKAKQEKIRLEVQRKQKATFSRHYLLRPEIQNR